MEEMPLAFQRTQITSVQESEGDCLRKKIFKNLFWTSRQKIK
jgi:hypothetical protein